MRYFRISTFTGIEGHRNKPDKGTMRVVEGCMPHPVGGLRSGPVWTKLTGYKLSYPLHSGRTGTITAIVDYSETVAGTIKMTDAGHGLVPGWSIDVSGTDDYNDTYTVTVIDSSNFYVTKAYEDPEIGSFPWVDTPSQYASSVADNVGNNYVFVSDNTATKTYELHAFQNAEDSSPSMGVSLTSSGTVLSQIPGTTSANATNIGSRNIAVGNGGANPAYIGLGPTAVTSTDFYALERNAFPYCTMFARGPHKTLYAAGNPTSKLTVYISEAAGVSNEAKDSMYSTGNLSKVKLLMTDASMITALSVLGPYVVVHTDAGVTLLYAVTKGQSSSGFRVEQVASPVSSGAVSQRVVGGQSTHPFFLGRDGQIWKDESTTAGPDGKPMYTDPRQVSWKAKGLWSDDSAADISTSFATYDPGIGMYFVHLPTLEA